MSQHSEKEEGKEVLDGSGRRAVQAQDGGRIAGAH